MVCDDKASATPLTTIWRPGHSGTQDLFDTGNLLAPGDPWLQIASAPENFILNPE